MQLQGHKHVRNLFRKSLLATVIFYSLPSSSAIQEIGFDKALTALFESNTPLAIQRARVEAADARLTGAKFSFLPSLSLAATTERQGDPETETKSLAATTTLNIFRFGADLARLDSTRYAYNSQRALLRAQELETEKDIVAALVSIVQKSQRLRVAQTTLDYSKRLLDIAQARFQRGVLPREEVDQVSIDLSNAEAAVRDAQRELNNSLAQVSALSEKSGLDPLSIQREWPWKDRFASPQVQKLATQSIDPAAAPELKGAELLLASTRAATKRSKRLLFPSLDFSYGARRTELDNGSTANGWDALLTLSVPLFEGLTHYTAYRVQVTEALIAEQGFRQALRDVPVRQELAQKNFVIAYQTALAREKTLGIARRLLDSSLARFRSGRANANALVLDQNRFSAAEAVAVDGWAQAHLALAELVHAFGQSVQR